MIEISIFQLWHLFNQENGTKGWNPFWGWVKRCGFSWTVGAASGMLINVPEYILEWGKGDEGR
jgi:hypothetical protein